jgi:hypothetical protein
MKSIRGAGLPSGSTAPPLLYRETQHFFRNWIFLIPIVAVTAVVWYEFAQQVVLGHPQGQNPIPNALAWALALIFGLGFPLVGLVLRLVTEVRAGELMVRLYPFRRRVIPTEVISKAIVREYSPIKEYGGWGIRVTRANGRAYNASGNRGVQLLLDNGNPVLIGSQRPDELLAALLSAGARLDEPKRSARRITRPAANRDAG